MSLIGCSSVGIGITISMAYMCANGSMIVIIASGRITLQKSKRTKATRRKLLVKPTKPGRDSRLFLLKAVYQSVAGWYTQSSARHPVFFLSCFDLVWSSHLLQRFSRARFDRRSEHVANLYNQERVHMSISASAHSSCTTACRVTMVTVLCDRAMRS